MCLNQRTRRGSSPSGRRSSDVRLLSRYAQRRFRGRFYLVKSSLCRAAPALEGAHKGVDGIAYSGLVGLGFEAEQEPQLNIAHQSDEFSAASRVLRIDDAPEAAALFRKAATWTRWLGSDLLEGLADHRE